MKYFKEFLNAYAPSMIHAAFVTIFSYIAIIIKNTYQNYMKDIQKKKVVETVCRAIEQLYPKMSGNDKLIEATNNCIQILKEKNIDVNELELRMYIESTVATLNKEKIS